MFTGDARPTLIHVGYQSDSNDPKTHAHCITIWVLLKRRTDNGTKKLNEMQTENVISRYIFLWNSRNWSR